MLGRFLEYSIATPDIRASLAFYGTLGFTPAQVGEAWNHPYAVLTDGRLCLGLHQQPDAVPSLTFVKPDLLKHLGGLERLGVNFEFLRLGNDVFNEVGWFDPSGHMIRLVEARTFSPSKRKSGDASLCGYFLEVALPTPARDSAKDYWERFGFVGMDETQAMLPHISLTSDTVGVGLYDPAQLGAPALLFEVDDLSKTLAALAALGLQPGGRMALPLQGTSCAAFIAPEGTPIILTAAPRAEPAVATKVNLTVISS